MVRSYHVLIHALPCHCTRSSYGGVIFVRQVSSKAVDLNFAPLKHLRVLGRQLPTAAGWVRDAQGESPYQRNKLVQTFLDYGGYVAILKTGGIGCSCQ